jgi:hypothetical protein
LNFSVITMRTYETKRAYKSFHAPVHSFDTDATWERAIRDPMSVLLGRSSLSVQSEPVATDPYNRVGRWAYGMRK